MIVRHTKISEFFDDLKLAIDNASRDPFVRVSVHSEPENLTTNNHFIVAGFLDDECLYELRIEVGCSYSEKQTKEAERILGELKKEIYEKCEQVGVKRGGGQWLLE